jgi:hypothetical protein
MNYRRLTEDENLRLKSQSCLADDWGKVTVAEEFSTEFVHHTRFSGEVCLGVFHSEFMLPGGIRKHSGLRHVTLHNVTVGDNCCIENIQNYIANYEIGHDTFIENVDIILVDGVSKRQETLWKSSWKQNCREYPILTVLVRVIAGGM